MHPGTSPLLVCVTSFMKVPKVFQSMKLFPLVSLVTFKSKLFVIIMQFSFANFWNHWWDIIHYTIVTFYSCSFFLWKLLIHFTPSWHYYGERASLQGYAVLPGGLMVHSQLNTSSLAFKLVDWVSSHNPNYIIFFKFL